MRDHDQTLLRLIEIGRRLVEELDPQATLERILDEARDITAAQYAALDVLSEDRRSLERSLTSGDGNHAPANGDPVNWPDGARCLNIAITIRGEPWGHMYVCDKADGEEFTQADADAVTVLAQWAATTIENARLYEHSEGRRMEAEHAVRSLQAAQDIADAIGSVAQLDHVLELIVSRGRNLVDAQSVVILLRDAEELVVAASAGRIVGELGRRIPIRESTTGQVLLHGRPQRISGTGSQIGLAASELGVPAARSALIVPMSHRSAGIGVLAAFDRGDKGDSFQLADEQLLRTFAASAANAVAIKRGVDADRLHATINAAEAERRRWARDLHDQTLQALGAMRVSLSSAVRRGEADGYERVIRQAIEDLEVETNNLRGIISDLRPSLLDDLGLAPALDALIERHAESGLEIDREIVILPPAEGGPKLEPELATTSYRLVQESLTNVVKHARARSCRVVVKVVGEHLFVEVTDNGVGYDTSLRTPGFGLPGMRERVYLAGGKLELESGNGGTVVRAYLPVDQSKIVRPALRARAGG